MVTTLASLNALAYPALIADIGGTNARFAIVPDAHAEARLFPVVQDADYPGIMDAIQAAVLDHTSLIPRSAVLAIAGPILGDRVPLTNSHWAVEPRALIQTFDLRDVVLLNDFEALALALPGLEPGEYDVIGDGAMTSHGPKLVVGPGTGLGAAGLLHVRNTWIPVPGEGGHIDLAPHDERDFDIWSHMERQASGRVSGEWILCGAGLVRLYQAVAAASGASAIHADPSAITAAGLAGDDPVATEALDRFASYLGRVAGDLALVLMATGGVFLAGGVATRLGPFLKRGAFREAFVDKDPHRAVMERMATVIITHPSPALAGLTAFVRTPRRFGLEVSGRHWRGA